MDNRTAFIIGNGFDLNLGLETSYSNFAQSDLFQRISLMGNNPLASHLRNKFTVANWIDIENELKVFYTNAISKSIQTDSMRNARKKDYNELVDALNEYIEIVNNTLASQINVKSRYFDLFNTEYSKFDNGFVACFNYTNTLDHLVVSPYAEVEYIHGKAMSKNIVLGVEDSFELKKEYNYYYKTANPNYNINNLTKAFRTIRRFVFMGHSLGETDHTLLQYIFQNATDNVYGKDVCEFTFYHYGKEDNERMRSEIRQMLENVKSTMTRFLGENNVQFIDISI